MLGFRVWDTERKRLIAGGVHMAQFFQGEVPMLLSGGNPLDPDKFILMQSTGIMDYRDYEIYEGDVLFIYIDTPTLSNHYYLVEDARTFLMYYGYINASIHKISNDGNIYENPELLERLK